jgi:hypothetical protein
LGSDAVDGVMSIIFPDTLRGIRPGNKIIGDLSFGATNIFHAIDITHKSAPDQENLEYFKRLGNTA